MLFWIVSGLPLPAEAFIYTLVFPLSPVSRDQQEIPVPSCTIHRLVLRLPLRASSTTIFSIMETSDDAEGHVDYLSLLYCFLDGNRSQIPVSDTTSSFVQDTFSRHPISVSSNSTAGPSDVPKLSDLDYDTIDVVGNQLNDQTNDLLGTGNGMVPLPDNFDDLSMDEVPSSSQTATALGPLSFENPLHSPFNKPRLDPDDVARFVNETLVKFNQAELSRMKFLLQDIQTRIESILQPRTEIETKSARSHVSPRSDSGVWYICVLCECNQSGGGRSYKTAGALKRHVRDEHTPQFEYNCPYRFCCDWLTHRRDKVHEHLRNKHGHGGRLSAAQIGKLEQPMPLPKSCPICSEPVGTWEELFQCIASHCRRTEGDRLNGNASRRGGNGGGRGGSSNGHQSWNSPGSGFGEMGNSSTFGKNSHADSRSNTGSGSRFTPYGRHQSESSQSVNQDFGLEAADEIEQEPCSDANRNHPLAEMSDPLRRVQPTGSLVTKAPRTIQTSKDEFPTSSWPPRPNIILDKMPLHGGIHPPNLRPGSGRSLFDKSLMRKQLDAVQQKCTTCGHIIGGCPRCGLLTQLPGICHFCVNSSPILIWSRMSQYLRNHDTFQDFACSGTPNSVLSTLRAYETVYQGSQVLCSSNYRLTDSRDRGSRLETWPAKGLLYIDGSWVLKQGTLSSFDGSIFSLQLPLSWERAIELSIPFSDSPPQLSGTLSPRQKRRRNLALRRRLQYIARMLHEDLCATFTKTCSTAETKRITLPSDKPDQQSLDKCSLITNLHVLDFNSSILRLFSYIQCMLTYGDAASLSVLDHQTSLAAILFGMMMVLADTSTSPVPVGWVE